MKTKRIEFKIAVKKQILERAGFPENPRCEGCGRSLKGERIEIDHIIECWEMREPRELTAEDGKALGAKCCHRTKTSRKTAERAHGNRIIKKAAGIDRKGKPMPGTRASGWRHKVNGDWERRDA